MVNLRKCHIRKYTMVSIMSLTKNISKSKENHKIMNELGNGES